MKADDPSPDPQSGDTLFARLMTEAAVSDSRFARQVNDRSRRVRRAELGLARTTVGHWRRGMRPRDPMVAELAAGELSTIVGYPVTPGDLGWRGDPHSGDDLGLTVTDIPADTLRTIAGLSGRDMRRRDLMLDGTAFVATAFADPVLRALTGVMDRVTHPGGGGGAPTGAMIRDMTATFRRLDARYGSGEIRSQVIGFLHDRTRAALDGAHTADLFSALSELTQFGGWLAQDSDRQSVAQRYYVQALALAEHADDDMLAGRVLSAMSDQAAHLGHLRHSLSLARAALDRAERHSSPGVRAMLHDKAAWALARMNDEAGCTAQLRAMETALGKGRSGDEPPWAGHYNDADVAECRGHCMMLLGKPSAAQQPLLYSRRHQGPERTRTRAYAEADLALSYLRQPNRDVEGALDAGDRALALATGLESQRVTAKVAELDRTVARHDRLVAVREWRAKAAVVLSPPAPGRPV